MLAWNIWLEHSTTVVFCYVAALSLLQQAIELNEHTFHEDDGCPHPPFLSDSAHTIPEISSNPAPTT
jgi:hypothetical protein